MHDIKRPLTAIAASAVLALAGGGTAWACGGDGSGDPGSYPGSYPGSTDTTSTDDGTSTTSATSSTAARRSRAARLRARHRHHR